MIARSASIAPTLSGASRSIPSATRQSRGASSWRFAARASVTADRLEVRPIDVATVAREDAARDAELVALGAPIPGQPCKMVAQVGGFEEVAAAREDLVAHQPQLGGRPGSQLGLVEPARGTHLRVAKHADYARGRPVG